MKKEWQSIHLLHSLFLTAHSLFLLLLTLSFTCCSLSFFLLLSSSMSFPFHLSIFLTLFFFSSSLIYLSLQQQWDDHNDETTRIMRWPWGWDKNEVEMQDNFFSCCLLSLSLAAHSLFSCCSLPLCFLLFAQLSFSLFFSPLHSSVSHSMMTMRWPQWQDYQDNEMTMRMRQQCGWDVRWRNLLISLKSVKQFIHFVEQEENQWFIDPCLHMFQIMCMEIREPIQKWTRQASLIVGEGRDAFVESDDSTAPDAHSQPWWISWFLSFQNSLFPWRSPTKQPLMLMCHSDQPRGWVW